MDALIDGYCHRCGNPVGKVSAGSADYVFHRVCAEAEEFEAAYATRSGVSVSWLHSRGRYAERCDCGEPDCEGWAMGHQQEDAIVENAAR